MLDYYYRLECTILGCLVWIVIHHTFRMNLSRRFNPVCGSYMGAKVVSVDRPVGASRLNSSGARSLRCISCFVSHIGSSGRRHSGRQNVYHDPLVSSPASVSSSQHTRYLQYSPNDWGLPSSGAGRAPRYVREKGMGRDPGFGAKIIPSKWLYKVKRSATGQMARCRAHLVACGNFIVDSEVDFTDIK